MAIKTAPEKLLRYKTDTLMRIKPFYRVACTYVYSGHKHIHYTDVNGFAEDRLYVPDTGRFIGIGINIGCGKIFRKQYWDKIKEKNLREIERYYNPYGDFS